MWLMKLMMMMPAPAGPVSNANATRQANHEKTVIKVNEQARKAMGILMGLFHPDCNAHRSLTTWYAEILPGLTTLQARRKDFNFRNAFEIWQGEYKPNKQYNLDTILKTWEALSDRDVSFAIFWGQYQKYRKEMEDIGHASTVEKEYEVLRKAVTNENLKSIVIKLNLPPAKRNSLDDFFANCLYVVRTSKELDTGRENGNGKRKAEGEAIVGRALTIQRRMSDRGIEDLACYRCGEVGHLKTDRVTGAKCQATRCTLVGRMLTVQEVVAIAVIRFFPIVISLLVSPSLLVQEVETSQTARQILLKARVRRTGRILGRRKLLTMALLMEFRVLLLFLLFPESYNR